MFSKLLSVGLFSCLIFESSVFWAQAAPSSQNDPPTEAHARKERGSSSQKHQWMEMAFDEHYEKALRFAIQGKTDDAIHEFENAIKLSPKNPNVHFNLGNVYFDSGQWSEAAKAYARTVDISPADHDAHNKLGVVYLNLGLHKRAINSFKRALRLSPRWSLAYYNLARAYHELGQRDNETAALSQAIRFNPSYAQTLPSVFDPKPVSTPTPAPEPEREVNLVEKVEKQESAELVKASHETARLVEKQIDKTAIYLVGPGDSLEIKFANSASDLPETYTVSPGGTIEILNKTLGVWGLTTDEIISLLRKELSDTGGISLDNIYVGVLDYASHNIIVGGLVANAGTKALRREAVPLYVVVADARPNPEAAQALVISAKGRERRVIDLNDSAGMNTLVLPGDVITVQKRPRQFFYIGGQVNSPGQKDYFRGMTLTQAILAAGGISGASSNQSRGIFSEGSFVRLVRQGNNGLLITTSYTLLDIVQGRISDPQIQADDRIDVALLGTARSR
jgi:tetratricopeptide (TPR) repeat protein